MAEETRIQFALGDLTLKMVPPSPHMGDQGVTLILHRYADQIGANVDTLRGYRHVSCAWPEEDRVPTVGWSIHRALDAVDKRGEVIRKPPDGHSQWTLDLALRAAGRTPNTPMTKDETLHRVRTLLRADEHAAEAVEEMLTRPEVASRVMAKPRTQRIVYQAHHDNRVQAAQARLGSARENTRAAGAKRRGDAPVDYTRASREALELIGIGTTYLVDMQRLIPTLHVAEFTDREIRAVLDNHHRIRAALDWCDSMITNGDASSPEEELARIIEGGESL
ncbi:MAG TPA: DUF6192 family protein [Actinokineospora sp.]|nr:DUF6192 family protein [Actinokineospora sp.]